MPDSSILDVLSGPEAYRLTPATMATHLTKGEGPNGTPGWIAAKHLMYISYIIASAISKGNGRIIVTMPPRHGKSELLSVNVPIWTLDNDPTAEVILASYGMDLATDFSRRVRDTILNKKADLHVRLRPDALGVARFLTTKGGGMRAAGIGGPITGRGADVFCIDDYIKNFKDASSEIIREDAWHWYLSTARTRLEPGASIIILATRWHIDDLVGRLLKMQPDLWTHIRLPAFAEEDDPLGREVGEALWPERYNAVSLNELRDSLGTFFWQAMYQQKPLASMLGLVKESWFPAVDIIPWNYHLDKVRFWDLAATADGGDWTSGTLLARDSQTNLCYVLGQERDQLSSDGVKTLVLKTAVTDGFDVKIVMEQEPGSAGKTVIQQYALDLAGYRFEGQRSTGSKLIKASGFMAYAEAGNVRLQRGSWNAKFVDEFMTFPEGLHDDQVDSSSGAYNALYGKNRKGATWGRDTDDTKDTQRGIHSGEIITGATWGNRD